MRARLHGDDGSPRRCCCASRCPNALPLILGGLRTATLQIVATATVAAYASLSGGSRSLPDRRQSRCASFYLALVGALLVDGAGADPGRRDGPSSCWWSEPGTDRFRRMPQPFDRRRKWRSSHRLDLDLGRVSRGGYETGGSVAYGRGGECSSPLRGKPRDDAWPANPDLGGPTTFPRMGVRAGAVCRATAIKAYGRIRRPPPRPKHPGVSGGVLRPGHRRPRGPPKRLFADGHASRERERQLSIARDEENMWLVQDHQNQDPRRRAAYDGALDVDVIYSPVLQRPCRSGRTGPL